MIPPTAATKTSAGPTATPARLLSTASNRVTRAASIPRVFGRVPSAPGPRRACTSTSSGRSPLEHRDHDAARDAGHAVPQQHGPGIGHRPQAVLAHFEDPHLARRPEPVLHRREHAQGVVPVPVEGEDGVDQVLDRPGAGQVAVLGDVADQDDRYAGGFGQPGQPVDAGSDLGEAPGGARQFVVGDGLDRIDDDQGRLVVDDGLLNGHDVVAGEGEQVLRHGSDPRRAPADLGQ